MKLRTGFYAGLMAILVLSGQAHADIITFQLDSIPNGVSSDSVKVSFLTLSMSNPSSNSGTIAAEDSIDNRGFTFDFQTFGFEDMWALDVSFDKDTRIIGYSTSVGTAGITLSFGNVSGLAATLGDFVLATPIDVSSGQAISIAESSADGPGNGYTVISSITVEAVPEPSAFLILTMSGMALTSRRRRKS